MSQVPLTASSSSDFQAIFCASLKAYEKKTKKDLLAHPLLVQLQTCDSPANILAVLRGQVQQFEQSTCIDDKLTKWLNPTVNVLFAFSAALGEGIGLVNSILFGRSFYFYDLPSDTIFLGVLTCQSDFCWCWHPPLGSY